MDQSEDWIFVEVRFWHFCLKIVQLFFSYTVNIWVHVICKQLHFVLIYMYYFVFNVN